MGRRKDLKNRIFGKLKALEVSSSTRHGDVKWNCICACGNYSVVSTDHLTRKKNPVKSCGCLKFVKGPQHKDWKGYGEISGGWWRLHITVPQKRRTRVKVEIDIKYGWRLFERQNKCCALTGIPLRFSQNGIDNTASLDRIDNTKGYIKGNVQWVHKDINMMKRVYTQEYFIKLCTKVARYSK